MDVTEITNQLQPLVRVFENDALTSEAAVRLQYPVWRTTFLPLAVLFEAWSRTTGMPTVFYIDSFAALLLGLINKDITVDVAGFPCQSRYWAVGTAQPGSGKSPAVDRWWSACEKFSVPTMTLQQASRGIHSTYSSPWPIVLPLTNLRQRMVTQQLWLGRVAHFSVHLGRPVAHGIRPRISIWHVSWTVPMVVRFHGKLQSIGSSEKMKQKEKYMP